MRRLLLWSLFLATLAPTNAAAQGPGVYFCVVERLAGIQPETSPSGIDTGDEKAVAEWRAKTKRTIGPLTPSPERFVLRVSPFQWKDDHLRQATCSPGGIEEMTRLMKCSGHVKFSAELASRGHDGKALNLFATNENIFHDEFHVFWIGAALNYSLVANRGLTGSFAEEGKCQTF